jgi:hypothetical protein
MCILCTAIFKSMIDIVLCDTDSVPLCPVGDLKSPFEMTLVVFVNIPAFRHKQIYRLSLELNV